MMTFYAEDVPAGARPAPCKDCGGMVAGNGADSINVLYSCIMCGRPAVRIVFMPKPTPPPPPGDWFGERRCCIEGCQNIAYPRSKKGYCTAHREKLQNADKRERERLYEKRRRQERARAREPKTAPVKRKGYGR